MTMDVTLIVAPMHLVDITGVAAIQISARKIKLCDATLKPVMQCSRKNTDDVTMPFLELVKLVCERIANK
jgi:hypothetical protein